MENNYYIVVVDDNLTNTSPLLARMRKINDKERVLLYKKVNEAISFIFEHLDEKFIVIMDCRFDNGSEQGVKGLSKIREKTSLVSIIMMSANPLNEMDNDDLAFMINSENIYFKKNSDMHGIEDCVKSIQLKWKTEVDCVLEQWVINHDDGIREKPYMCTNDGIKSLNDLLVEVRKRTPLGIEVEKEIIQNAIDILTRKNNKQ